MGSAKLKAAAAGAACVVVGALAGIVGASAAPTSKSPKSQPGVPQSPGAWRTPRGRGMGMVGRVVHAEVIVLNRAGTKFITATEDSGTVQSVSGDKLTIKEALGNVTYRTVTLTIPTSASVRRNFATVALSALKSGDRVRVVQSSDGTDVDAISLGALRLHHPGWGPGPWMHPRPVPGGGVPGAPPGGGSPGAAPLPQPGGAPAGPPAGA